MMVARNLWSYLVVVALTAVMLTIGAISDWGTGATYGVALAVLVPAALVLVAVTSGLGRRDASVAGRPIPAFDLRLGTHPTGPLVEESSGDPGLSTAEEDEGARLSLAIAGKFGLSALDRATVENGMRARNVGYRYLPRRILSKPGKLTEAEFEQLKRHPEHGQELLEGAGDEALRTAARVVRASHERWDGRGYPDGLRGR